MRLLNGEPLEPGDGAGIFWWIIGHRVEGLPEPESDEGRALLAGRRPGVEGS